MSTSLEKFRNFLRSFGAARLLLQKAHENGSLIEGLILYASLADGLCRIGLVLNEQIETKTDNINEKYIYQEANESNFNERAIYRKAKEKKIIGTKLFNELNALYDIRNKMVHRFFISEIEYSHLEIVCDRHEKVYDELFRIIYDLEAKQIDIGVGMTRKGRPKIEAHKAVIDLDIGEKIRSASERNLAKTFDCTSVEEVIEFGSRNGLFVDCVCGHTKVMHMDLKKLKENESDNLDDGLAKCLTEGCSCSHYESSREIEQ